MQDNDTTRQDEAVAARLRKLSSFPVDLGRLERQIRAEITPSEQQQQRPSRMRLLRPLTAIAASITILAVIAAAVLTASSSQVMA